MALDHSCQVQRHPLSERGLDLYETPPVAVQALLRVEKIPSGVKIWEPCAGKGAIVKVLRERGYSVIASDVFDYGGLDFVGDFLEQTEMPQNCRAQAMPKQGASSGFKYGRAVGTIEAAIACCEIPITLVEPAMWKRYYKLQGKDKEGARQRALQLFPSAHALLARKKDHGKAEASLLALYGAARSGVNHAAAA